PQKRQNCAAASHTPRQRAQTRTVSGACGAASETTRAGAMAPGIAAAFAMGLGAGAFAGTGAVRGSSDPPHVTQKRKPTSFHAPQRAHVTFAASGARAGAPVAAAAPPALRGAKLKSGADGRALGPCAGAIGASASAAAENGVAACVAPSGAISRAATP